MKEILGRGQSFFQLKLVKMTNFINWLFRTYVSKKRFRVQIKSISRIQKQNASYDTQNVEFQPYVVFPLGLKSKIKLSYSVSQTELSNPFGIGTLMTSEVNEGKVTSSRLVIFIHMTQDYIKWAQNGVLLNLGKILPD